MLQWIWRAQPKPLQQVRHCLILDSSFNPPTRAHLELCRQAIRHQLPSTKDTSLLFLLMLSRSNVDKSEVQTKDTQHRLAMMQCMAEHVWTTSTCASMDVAVVLTDAPRFLDKARLLRTELPNTSLSFIMGLDTLNRFFMKKYYGGITNEEELASLLLNDFFAFGHTLMVAPRSMEVKEKQSETAEDGLGAFYTSYPVAERFRASIVPLTLDMKMQVVSSTAVRQSCHEGRKEQWQSMVLPEVAAYIEQHHVYE